MKHSAAAAAFAAMALVLPEGTGIPLARTALSPVACTRSGYLDLTWSPNGKQIAYTTGVLSRVDEALCRMQRDGRGVRLVATPSACDLDWSPDGLRFVITDCGERVLVVDVDGRRTTQRVRAEATQPEWSPDGEKIVYVRHKWPLGYEIDVMNADGRGQRRVASGGAATWSPDGKKLAVVQDAADSVAVVNLDGRRLRKLRLPRDSSALSLDWSPDGRTIVYAEGAPAGGRARIFALDLRTSRVRALTRTGCDLNPEWSPDGRKIGFVSYRGSRGCNDMTNALSQIYVMNADGTRQQRLTR